MKKLSMVVAAGLGVLAMTTAWAADGKDYGTAEEARSMLTRAVEALKADASKALASFNSGADGFRDRDLYVACSGEDGKVSAHPDKSLIGQDRLNMKDANGKAFGAEVQAVAKEGEIAEVSYVYPRPGDDKTPVPKVAFVTKAAGQICLVGHYK